MNGAQPHFTGDSIWKNTYLSLNGASYMKYAACDKPYVLPIVLLRTKTLIYTAGERDTPSLFVRNSSKADQPTDMHIIIIVNYSDTSQN